MTPHEPPVTVDDVIRGLQSCVAPGSEVLVVRCQQHRVTGLDRWIVAEIKKHLTPREMWLPTAEHASVFPAVARAGWKPVWGAGDSDRGVPAAPISWSLLWTRGPGPLRVWDRRGLLLHIDEKLAGGRALGAKSYAVDSLTPASIVERFGGLQWTCSVGTPSGPAKIASAWILDEDMDTAHLVALAEVINAKLSATGSERFAQGRG